jgi:DNA-binding HxlR family transcriptional regulator
MHMLCTSRRPHGAHVRGHEKYPQVDRLSDERPVVESAADPCSRAWRRNAEERPTSDLGRCTANFVVTLIGYHVNMHGKPIHHQDVDTCQRGDAALARGFALLGKRWNGLVLGSLRAGPAGFRELSRAIGRVSDSVLSDRLAGLVGAGLVTRTVSEGPPVAVTYELTASGRALVPALEQISLWAQEHLPFGQDDGGRPAETVGGGARRTRLDRAESEGPRPGAEAHRGP